MNLRRRRFPVLAAASTAVVLGGMAGAFGCVNIATLTLSGTSGPAGARVTATGTGYSATAPVLPVILRWNTTEGPELARVVPDQKGEIKVDFVVPDAAPGYYGVISVHRDATGVDRYGTPGRAVYEIVAAAAPGPPVLAADRKPSDPLPVETVVAGVVLLAAAAAGLRMVAARRQTGWSATL